MRESLQPFATLPASYVVLDTETTGLPDTSGLPGIVSLGITCVQNRIVKKTTQFKVKPYRPILKEAENIHGISNEQASTFTCFEKAWPLMKVLLDNHLLVMHNAGFDWPILEFHLVHFQCEPPVVKGTFCSQQSAIRFAEEEGIALSRRGPSLDNLSDFLKIESLRHDGIHGAGIDSRQTAFVVERLRQLALSGVC